MPKIKLTKSELKSQRDDLKQYARFLPTLQLKKQQLQLEARKSLDRIESNRRREKQRTEALSGWLVLFSDNAAAARLATYLKLEEVLTDDHNIAGAKVPLYRGARFSFPEYDLFDEPLWIDDAIKALKEIIEIRAERDILEEQYRRINQELRTTTQRVNLFEKVKIPECRENIRVIQIYLGDQQTAAVGRSKIAKRKNQGVSA